MTDTELNEALAKGMGWHEGVSAYSPYYDKENKVAMQKSGWHPASSLDQMHLVEERIIELGLNDKYALILHYDILGASGGMFELAHATARQKAEAAVRVFKEVRK